MGWHTALEEIDFELNWGTKFEYVFHNQTIETFKNDCLAKSMQTCASTI